MGKLIVDKKNKAQTVRSSTPIVVDQLSKVEQRWFAVYTKYKCEKYVAQQLLKKKVESYLPIITKTKRYTRKIKHYEVPLINCYVFVNITRDQYISVVETEYVMKFLRSGKDLLAIPQDEIDILKRVVGDVEEVRMIEKIHFDQGEEVEVTSGQLTGMKGKVISQEGKRTFVIALETMGYELMIKIDHNLLRPLNNKYLIA
ncbi:MAG: UpxY family transcription antiterminator [Saprospiraceae bacterium]